MDRDTLLPARAASHLLNETWLSPDGLPARRPSTLMSSSSLLQWIPCPRPINCQLFRSAAVAWNSLGNQASGTERLRPSLSSTVSVSSVTVTVSAAGTEISTAEVFFPRLPQTVLMCAHGFLNPIQLRTGKTAALLQTDWIKPKLRNLSSRSTCT